MFLDKEGLITQADGDAGDQLQREGFWFEGWFLNPSQKLIPGLAPYRRALQVLKQPTGFARSWLPGTSQPPWNDPSDCSRDQLVSNVRACGYYEFKDVLSYIFWGVIKNFSRFPNGDIAFINDYGRFIRAFKLWYLWPLLFILDLPMPINSIIRVIKGKASLDDVGDDINHIGDLAQAQKTYPTLISLLARKIYIWWRPNYAVACRNGAEYALYWYFRPESKANPEFINLWNPIVDNF